MDEAQALTALSALANAQRLALVRLLMVRAEGMPAGEIAAALGLSASRLSFHLAALEGAGLIGSRRAGRQVVYAAERAVMGQLIDHLLNHCCAGDPQVSACCRAVA
jgi:DNA-binding transcriptional ArsR family regulator